MNTKLKTRITTLALTAALLGSTAQAQDGAAAESSVGLGGGALLGAMAGGPLGAVLGAGVGLWLGGKVGDGRDLPETRLQLAGTQADLHSTRQALDMAEGRIHRLQGALQDRDIRLASAAQINSAPDLAASLADGLEIDVLFRTGQSELTGSVRQRLDDLAAMLASVPDLRVRLDGHSDPRGDEGYNQKLSEARIDQVRSALRAGGIEPGRISVFAHGEQASVAREGDLDAFAFERRVSIRFVSGGGVATVAANPVHPQAD